MTREKAEVYEWQWIYPCENNRYILGNQHLTEAQMKQRELEHQSEKHWIKFEPSKRIRK